MKQSDFEKILDSCNIKIPNRSPRSKEIKNGNKDEINLLNEHLENVLKIINHPEIKKLLNVQYKEFDNREHIKNSLTGIIKYDNLLEENDEKSDLTNTKFKKLKSVSKMAFLLSSYERLAHILDPNTEASKKFYSFKNQFAEELLKSFFINANKNLAISLRYDQTQSNHPFVLEIASNEILPFSIHANLDTVVRGLEKNRNTDDITPDVQKGKYKLDIMNQITCNNFFALPMRIDDDFEKNLNEETQRLRDIDPSITESDIILYLVNQKVEDSINIQFSTKAFDKYSRKSNKSFSSIDRSLEKAGNFMDKKKKDIDNQKVSSLIHLFSVYKYDYSDIKTIIENKNESLEKINKANEKFKTREKDEYDKACKDIAEYKKFLNARFQLLTNRYDEKNGKQVQFLSMYKVDDYGDIDVAANINEQIKENDLNSNWMINFFASVTDLEKKQDIIQHRYSKEETYNTDSISDCNNAFCKISSEVVSSLEYKNYLEFSKKIHYLQELYIISESLLPEQNVNLAEISNIAYQYGMQILQNKEKNNANLEFLNSNVSSGNEEIYKLLEHQLNQKYLNQNNLPILNFLDSSHDNAFEIEKSKDKRTERIKFYLQYIKIFENPDIEIPKEIESITDSGIIQLFKLSKELDLNPFNLNNLEQNLNQMLKNEKEEPLLDFTDNSFDEILEIDGTSNLEKRYNRISLNLKFIEQQYPEQYSIFSETYPNISQVLGGESYENEVFPIILANEEHKKTLVKNLNSKDSRTAYLKDMLEIKEIPIETSNTMEEFLIKQIKSNKISNSNLKSITLKNQKTLTSLKSENELLNIKRIATVKLAISKTKYSDEQKEYLMDVLKNIASQEYNLDNNIFNKLEFDFENNKSQPVSDWDKFLEQLNSYVDDKDLNDAAKIFEELKKEREGEAK